jgi:hypothetical protein
MPTQKGMFAGRMGTALLAFCVVFTAPSIAEAATTTTSSSAPQSTTTTTTPPNLPPFTLPTDDGLKLIQEHNQAEAGILSSQSALKPAQIAAAHAQASLVRVEKKLRKLNAQERKTAKQMEAARENLRAAAVEAYIRSGSTDFSTTLDALSSADNAVDAGHNLHMISTYGDTEKQALDTFIALKERVDAEVQRVTDLLDSAQRAVQDTQSKLAFIRGSLAGAKQMLADSVVGMLKFHAAATSALSPILGPSRLSAKQMADYLKFTHAKPHITVSTRKLAQLYLSEGAKLGVRGDVAFAQSILETGGFAHPGSAPDNNNFAGIGWCDSCKHGVDFASAQLGVRAQMQELRIYVDPTFPDATYTDPILLPDTLKLGFRGKVQTWWDLWGTWATGALYGQRVYDIYEKMVAFSKLDPDPTPKPHLAKKAAAKKAVKKKP